MDKETSIKELQQWDGEFLVIALIKKPENQSYYFSLNVATSETLGSIIKNSISFRVFVLSEPRDPSYYLEIIESKNREKEQYQEILLMQELMAKHLKTSETGLISING